MPMRKEYFELIASILQCVVEQKGNIQEVRLNPIERQENTKTSGARKGQYGLGHEEWTYASENDLKIDNDPVLNTTTLR